MSDSYQAIFDAVRSRISGGNMADAVERVAREAFDLGMLRLCIQQDFSCAAAEMQRPSVLYRPTLSADGTSWHALYGANIQEGVSGFGDTAAAAMDDFDRQWRKEKTPAQCVSERERVA
jgi:hypothetical protein